METIELQILQIDWSTFFLPEVLNSKEKQDFSAQNPIRISFCTVPQIKVRVFYPLTAKRLCDPTWHSWWAQGTCWSLVCNKGSSYLGHNKAVLQKEWYWIHTHFIRCTLLSTSIKTQSLEYMSKSVRSLATHRVS